MSAAAEVLQDLKERGYTATVNEGRLKLRGPCKPPPELEQRIRASREELLRALQEPTQNFAPVTEPEHPLDCPCVDCSTTGPKYADPIEGVGEVFKMARAILNPTGIDYGPPPVPPAPKGHDPMVKPHAARARFYEEVRRKNQERRARGDWPPHIRPVDGGVS